ncbi:hypothetical protein EV177_011044, partial [Coemansia sp. RSA 1804]
CDAQPQPHHRHQLLSGSRDAHQQHAAPADWHWSAGSCRHIPGDAHAVRLGRGAPAEPRHLRDDLLRSAGIVVRARREAGRVRVVCRQPCLAGKAAARPVEPHAVRPLGLGCAACAHCSARHSQLAAGCADANSVDIADSGLQRVLRAVHLQPVHAA